MFGDIPVQYFNVIPALLIMMVVILGALLLFKFVWMDNYDFRFPRGRYYGDEIDPEDPDTIVAHNTVSYFKLLRRILIDLDPEYWMKYAGFDAYSYICFQRRLMRAFGQFFALNMLVFVGLYLTLVFEQGSTSKVERLLETAKFGWMMPFYACINLAFITMIVVQLITGMRRHLQGIYYITQISSAKDHGLNYLKLRTVEFESEDIPLSFESKRLSELIKSQVSNLGLDVKINSVMIIPDYSRLFDLECQRAELVANQRIISEHKPRFLCLVPAALSDRQAFSQKLREIEFEIDAILTREVKASRTAFVCFDSLAAITYLDDHFRNTYFGEIKSGLAFAGQGAKAALEKIGEINKMILHRRRTINERDREQEMSLLDEKPELFPKEPEDDEADFDALESSYVGPIQNLKLEMKTFPHPIDINWRLIKGETDSFLFQKILIFLASLLVLIFLTTPAALLQIMTGSNNAKNTKLVGWASHLPGSVQFIVQSFLPPLIIIAVNSILLLFIQYLVEWKYLNRFSEYQISILRHSFIYFLFNMLIVPGFVGAAVSNLYELLIVGMDETSSLFNRLFQVEFGDFFLILVLQQAGVTFLMQLTSLTDLFGYYLSPLLTLQHRVLLAHQENWRKGNDTIFGFGLSYAQQLVILSIGIVFSGSIIFMPLAVMFYFLVRHIADTHQLLIWHRQEIESSGALTHVALKRILWAVLLLQVSTLFKQIFEGYKWSVYFILMMIVLTLIYYYFLNRRPLITADKFPDDMETFNQNMLNRWWTYYSHPMVAKGTEDITSKTGDDSFFKRSTSEKSIEKGVVKLTPYKSPPKLGHELPNVRFDENEETPHRLNQSLVGAKPKSTTTKQNKHGSIHLHKASIQEEFKHWSHDT